VANFSAMMEALYKGEIDQLKAIVQQAVSAGTPAADILHQGLLKGMDKVGEDFREGILFVPEVIFASRAMSAAMELLQPLLTKEGVEPIGRVILGTVKGDVHTIGKSLVGMMLRGAGFQVEDLGPDVSVEKFLEAARRGGRCIVGMSALLTTTMPVMGRVVEALKKENLKNVRTMVGGAPVTQDFATEIGADGYAPDAADAADLAKRLLGAGA
jgi:5-methyltetrahydrofolate--homocysteine methyltransferase